MFMITFDIFNTTFVPYIFCKLIFRGNYDHNTPLCDTPQLDDMPLCDTRDDCMIRLDAKNVACPRSCFMMGLLNFTPL